MTAFLKHQKAIVIDMDMEGTEKSYEINTEEIDPLDLELWRIKMNKELCFILENKNVYLDHILVDYEYVPIFLLCKDDECQYYLALCTNIENGEYIVVKISLLSVYNMEILQ